MPPESLETSEGAFMKLHEYQARDILATYGIPVTGGGVASTPAEARRIAEQIGDRVVVKAITYEREIYLGIIMDRAAKRIVVMASSEGGVEIEEVAKTKPESIVKI